jgi:PPM family protein phosphatase
MRSTVRVGAVSHIGMRRRNNQDSYASLVAEGRASWERFGHLFVVADGMGAHAAGELASRLAVDLIPHHYNKQNQERSIDNLHRAMIEANNEIFRRGQANLEFRNMGTTTSVLAILPEGAICAHVGDSRIYFLRGNQFEQLTFDHSLVWEMQLANGQSNEQIDLGMIPKNVITRSLGPNASVLIDLEGPFPVRVGDKFLLCSDGLSGQLTDVEIGVLTKLLSPAMAAQAMVDLANLRGGPDNITVIIVEVFEASISTQSKGFTPRASFADKSNPFPVGIGIAVAIAVLAAFIFYTVGHIALAISAISLGLFALGIAAIRYGILHQPNSQIKDRYGRAPYRRYTCDADATMVERLAGTFQALQEAMTEKNLSEPNDELGEMRKLGELNASQKKYSEAICNYSEAMVKAMQLLRAGKK